MTVSTIYAPITYSGNDATVIFSVSTYWTFDDEADVVVTHTDGDGTQTVWTQGGEGDTGYTLTETEPGNGNWNVTANTAPASGTTLTITRVTPVTQELDLQNGRKYQSDTMESHLDRIVMQIQEDSYSDTSAASATAAASSASAALSSASAAAASAAQIGSLYYTPDSSEADQGVAAIGDGITLYDAATAAGSKKATIILNHDPSNTETEYTLDTSIDWSSLPNLFLEIKPGATLTRTTGDETITLYSPENIIASDRQKITSIDMIDFSSGGTVYPSWWGMAADGATNDSAAFQSAVNSVDGVNGVVVLPAGAIIVESGVTISNSTEVVGSGKNNTTIAAGGNFTSIIQYTASNDNTPNRLADMTISTTGTTTQCVNVGEQTNSLTKMSFERCKFIGNLTGNLFYSSGILVDIHNCEFSANSANTVALQFDRNNQNSKVYDSLFNGSGVGIQVIDGGAGQTCEGIIISGNTFVCAGAYQIELAGDAAWIRIVNNTIDQNEGNYIHILSGAQWTTISGNYIGGGATSTGTAVYIEETAGDHHKIVDNEFLSSGIGVYVKASGADVVNDVVVRGNIFSSMSVMAVRFDSVTNAIVSDNIDDSSSPSAGSWGTEATVTNGTYTVSNNSWQSGALSFFDASATYYLSNNSGTVTNSGGLSSAISSGGTIAHGLFTTPSIVNLSSADAGVTSIFWSADATNITVSYSGGGTHAFHWEAKVR